jgi:hypothetical protein
VGVIELNGYLGGERLEGRMGLEIAFDNIPYGAGHQKVLLDQPEFLASRRFVRGIQHLGNGLRGDLLLDGLEITSRH